MVVANVQNDGQATLVASANEMLKLVGTASAGLQTKEEGRAVAPFRVAIEFQHGQEFHRVYTEVDELVDEGHGIREGSSRGGRISEGAHV